MFKSASLLRTAAAGLLIVILAVISGCGTAAKIKTADAPDPSAGPADSDHNNAAGLKTIPFLVADGNLTAEATALLTKNVEVLKTNPKLRVLIEGHCDDRGSIMDNIALGDKRAATVKAYLVAAGIAPDRLTTLSYGKEKPLEKNRTQESFGRNRRANFVIIGK